MVSRVHIAEVLEFFGAPSIAPIFMVVVVVAAVVVGIVVSFREEEGGK